MSTSTVVLVHGAFADAGSWRTTIPLVDAVDVIAAPNPLRGIAADTAYLDGLLDSFERELVLVGHSYGGAVISGVTRNAARVRALVFIAAYIPDEVETLTIAGDPERYPGGLLGPDTLLPCPVPGGVDLFIRPDRFPEVFAADVPEAEAAVMARSQRPIAAAAFVEPRGTAAVAHRAVVGAAGHRRPRHSRGRPTGHGRAGERQGDRGGRRPCRHGVPPRRGRRGDHGGGRPIRELTRADIGSGHPRRQPRQRRSATTVGGRTGRSRRRPPRRSALPRR